MTIPAQKQEAFDCLAMDSEDIQRGSKQGLSSKSSSFPIRPADSETSDSPAEKRRQTQLIQPAVRDNSGHDCDCEVIVFILGAMRIRDQSQPMPPPSRFSKRI